MARKILGIKDKYGRIGDSFLRLLIWFSRGASRWLLFLTILIWTAWLGYQNAWRPLQEDVPLPAGVLEQNPELNVDLLRSINGQRNVRLSEERPTYESFANIFAIPDTGESAI